MKPKVEMFPGQLINLTVNNFQLSMKCILFGNQFVHRWEKRNKTTIPRSQGINSRMLTINDLRPEDSGEYRCIVSNSTGIIFSDYKPLTIEGLEYMYVWS